MASAHDFKGLKDTSLPNVVEYFNALGKIPDVSTNDNEQGYTLTEKKFHEAAYDAYMTGLAFLGISNSLGKFFFKIIIESTYYTYKKF